MATYGYICYSCGHKLDVIMPIKEYDPDDQPVCPNCGKCRMNRTIDRPEHILKGDNWAAKGKKGY